MYKFDYPYFPTNNRELILLFTAPLLTARYKISLLAAQNIYKIRNENLSIINLLSYTATSLILEKVTGIHQHYYLRRKILTAIGVPVFCGNVTYSPQMGPLPSGW
jgi:hypothetical protein